MTTSPPIPLPPVATIAMTLTRASRWGAQIQAHTQTQSHHIGGGIAKPFIRTTSEVRGVAMMVAHVVTLMVAIAMMVVSVVLWVRPLFRIREPHTKPSPS